MKVHFMTMKQTFAALGGPTKIGNALGIRPQAVSLWVIRNQIPFKRIPSLISIAKSEGIELNPEDLCSDINFDSFSKTNVVAHSDLQIIEKLSKINKEQAKEIAKLKNVIQALVA